MLSEGGGREGRDEEQREIERNHFASEDYAFMHRGSPRMS
jgi:hypothetical protein